jgi:hypothetical protein
LEHHEGTECRPRCGLYLLALRDESNDHSTNLFSQDIISSERIYEPVEVVKEGKQIEAKLDEAFLLVVRKCTENFCGIIHMVFVAYPVS